MFLLCGCPWEKILDSPPPFTATTFMRKKKLKRSLFYDHSNLHYIFYNSIGTSNYVIINWSQFVSTPVCSYRCTCKYKCIHASLSIKFSFHSLEVITPGHQQSCPPQPCQALPWLILSLQPSNGKFTGDGTPAWIQRNIYRCA